MDEEVSGGDVLETAATALGEGGAQACGYDDVVWGLGEWGKGGGGG